MEFPKSTEFYKRIPKQKFYDKLSMTPALKEGFKSIKTVHWRNKLSPDTINLEPGESVKELQIFEIKLSEPEINEAVLKQIDKQIPYHILHLVEYDGKYQAWIAYKETGKGSNAFVVDQYYHTDWLPEAELPIKLEGLNLDSVYENFVRQIAGDKLAKAETEKPESLKETVDRTNQIQKLEKQIAALQKKIKREKQLNKQMEMNAQLKQLRKELEEIKNGKNEDGIH